MSLFLATYLLFPWTRQLMPWLSLQNPLSYHHYWIPVLTIAEAKATWRDNNRQVCWFLLWWNDNFPPKKHVHNNSFSFSYTTWGFNRLIFFPFWLALPWVNSEWKSNIFQYLSSWNSICWAVYPYFRLWYLWDSFFLQLVLPSLRPGGANVLQWINFLCFVCLATLRTHFTVTYISLVISSVCVICSHMKKPYWLLRYAL